MKDIHAKFTLKYSYVGSEDYSPVDVTFEIPGDSTVDQMLFNFQCFLKACGFIFEGEFVQSYPEEEKEEPEYGCMADWDEECGCDCITSILETSKQEEQFDITKTTHLGDSISTEEYQKQQLKNWNKGIAKLDNELKEQREIREKAYKSAEMCAEVAKNNWVHGMCNPPSPDWKKSS